MAFNGSGTYTLPAGNPVVTGTTISSSTTNTTNSDIATALTNCITRDGQSTPSANLPMNAKKLTGLAAGTSAGDSVRYEQVVLTSALGTNVATFLATPSSANLAAALTDETGSGAAVFATSPTLNTPVLVTPALGTPSSGTLSSCAGLPLTSGVTGTLPVGNGGTGAATLASNNVLLGNGTSALQAVAPGASGNVLMSNGTTWTSAGAPSGLTLLSTVTASSSSTVDMETTFNGTYDAYLIVASGITVSDGGAFYIRFKIAGSYATSDYQYIFQENAANDGTTYVGTGQIGMGYIEIAGGVTNGGNDFSHFEVRVYKPTDTSHRKYVTYSGVQGTSASVRTAIGVGGYVGGNGALTGVRFYRQIGTINTGSFRLYGISNS